jgi:chromate reductase
MKIAVVIGSLRKESLSRKVADALIALAPKTLDLEIIDIENLPLYNEDLDFNEEVDLETPPEEWRIFRKNLESSEGVLFITPEYNRSLPGCLKNAVDVGSRPYGRSVWSGKPAGVVSVSPGSLGGFGANHHLRQCLVFLDMPAMPQPEAYIGHAGELFNPDGKISDPKSKEFFVKFIAAYSEWALKFLGNRIVIQN